MLRSEGIDFDAKGVHRAKLRLEHELELIEELSQIRQPFGVGLELTVSALGGADGTRAKRKRVLHHVTVVRADRGGCPLLNRGRRRERVEVSEDPDLRRS